MPIIEKLGNAKLVIYSATKAIGNPDKYTFNEKRYAYAMPSKAEDLIIALSSPNLLINPNNNVLDTAIKNTPASSRSRDLATNSVTYRVASAPTNFAAIVIKLGTR
jgi:hypothetical protein